jgi:gamma-glutamyltranspeptidase/glutathione hydrolase
MADLAAYHVRCEPPATVNYRGYDVYATGPWGQGPVFPQALKILEGFDLPAMGHNSAAYVHTVNQALNLAFADREQYIGDPAFVDVPMQELLSEAYLRERRKLIDPQRAWPPCRLPVIHAMAAHAAGTAVLARPLPLPGLPDKRPLARRILGDGPARQHLFLYAQ